MKNSKSIAFFLSILIAFAAITSVKCAFASPDKTLKDYIDAVKNRHWENAESLWMEEDIARFKHLGITFSGIDAKYDCTSPLIYSDQKLIDSLCRIEIRVINADSNTAEVCVDLICSNGDSVAVPYYLIKKNDEWRICSSLNLYADDWYSLKTRFFNVIFTDSSLINSNAINELDKFTDSLGAIFDIADERMQTLENLKIDYYLCSEKQIRLLTGYDAHGMTSLPFDAIITRHLPHKHEIAHLMINYALKEAQLFTLPLLQEGLACCLGGRWGKSPAVINYWGASIVNLNLAELESILAASGFNSCPVGLDGAYAISSLFAQTLIDDFGMAKFMEMYQMVSGSSSDFNSISSISFIEQAETIFGDKWEMIKSKYNKLVAQNTYGGIIPGKLDKLNEGDLIYASHDTTIGIRKAAESYFFEIILPAQKSNGTIFFSDDEANNDPSYKSWQFEQQHPDGAYNGEFYGLNFNPQEVGLYDYKTNTLLAKYVLGFTPDQEYFDESSRTLTFLIPKSFFNKDLTSFKIAYQFKN